MQGRRKSIASLLQLSANQYTKAHIGTSAVRRKCRGKSFVMHNLPGQARSKYIRGILAVACSATTVWVHGGIGGHKKQVAGVCSTRHLETFIGIFPIHTHIFGRIAGMSVCLMLSVT